MLVVRLSKQPENGKIDKYHDKCEPDAGIIIGLDIFAAIGILLKDHTKQSDKTACTHNCFERNCTETCKSATGKDAQIKAKHKAIAIIEPVWFLKAMPNKVGDTERKAGNEDQDKYTGNDLLAHGILVRQKIRRE